MDNYLKREVNKENDKRQASAEHQILILLENVREIVLN